MIQRLRDLFALTTAAAVVSACAPGALPQRTAHVAEAALEQPMPGAALAEGQTTADSSLTVPSIVPDAQAFEVELAGQAHLEEPGARHVLEASIGKRGPLTSLRGSMGGDGEQQNRNREKWLQSPLSMEPGRKAGRFFTRFSTGAQWGPE